jgi:amidase
MPFAPTLDTVGVIACNANVLQQAAAVLLASEPAAQPDSPPTAVHLLTEAFALANREVQQALELPVDSIRRIFGTPVRETSLGDLCQDAQAGDLETWVEIYRALQSAETMSSLAAWIAATNPEFGPATQAGFEFIKKRDRTRIGDALRRREHYFRRLRQSLGHRDLLCLPTAPAVAPFKGSHAYNRDSDYYRRTLSLTAIAGVARLPQVSMPLATANGAPIGISLMAAHGEDMFLLQVANEIERNAFSSP